MATIVSKTYRNVSPYLSLVEKTVKGDSAETSGVYHGVSVNDYLAIVARTSEGTYVLVRQYRPIVEQYTWELPAGTCEPGETPETGIARELEEETGYKCTLPPKLLGILSADTGRIENTSYGFFADRIDPAGKGGEQGVETACFSRDEVVEMIRTGAMAYSLHISYFFLHLLTITSGWNHE